MKVSALTLAIACIAVIAGCNGTSPKPHTAPPTPSTAATFVDVAQSAGVNYTWSVTGKRPLNILQTIGDGCGFLDFNNDGNLDILLVGPKLGLYRGDGHGQFTDITVQAGLGGLHGDFRGCAVGDYDNDGYDDVYLSAVNGGALLHNEHGTRFVDVTRAGGIASQPWGSSCAFVDVDGDGRLDLVVGNYVAFNPDRGPVLCPNGSFMAACGPNYYPALHPVLYHNAGSGKFLDITKTSGFDKAAGKALGVAVADIDGSGRPSIALANDEMPGDLFVNKAGRLTNIGASSGTAFDANASKHAGMGIDWGDYDNDGLLDLVVTTYQYEPKAVYHNDGADLFTEQSSTLGVGDATKQSLAFGVKWVDVDNDGFLDLMIANGHVEDNIHDIDPRTNYRQPLQLLRNESGRRFTDISSALTGPALRPIVGRGLAVGDYDNDGRVDALVVDSEGAPLLLHNETKPAGNWLEVELAGTKSNRDGQGAVITVDVGGGLKVVRQCSTSGSYLSASDRRVHFGLGNSGKIATISVNWPSGHTDTYQNPTINKALAIKEGEPAL